MAYATSLRTLSALCAFLSFTLILAPITAPLAVMFYRQAKKKEREREQGLAATQ